MPPGAAALTGTLLRGRSASSKRSVFSQVARRPKAFSPDSEFRVMLDLSYFFAGACWAHRGPCSAVQVAAHASQRAPGVLTEQVAFSCCNLAGVYTLFAALYLVCFQIEAPPGPFLVASGLADAAFIAGSCRCLAATSLAPPTRPPVELCTAAFASPTLL